MENLKQLADRRRQHIDAMDALVATAEAEDRDLTDDEQTQFDEHQAAVKQLDRRMERMLAVQEVKEQSNEVVDPIDPPPSAAPIRESRPTVLPATAHRYGGLAIFNTPDRAETAYKQGMLMLASLGRPEAARWCHEHGIAPQWVNFAVHEEGNNATGGYMVLPEFDREVIKLELQYGAFLANARRVPMSSDRMLRVKKEGGLTAYAIGESDQITESTSDWSQKELIAKSWGVLTRISNELAADTVISLMDELAQDVALAMAQKIDECGFNGDGTSTYHGILGVRQRLSDVNGADDGGGLVLGSGNAWSELTLANFHSVLARTPTYGKYGGKWFCSPAFYESVMVKLQIAAGGNTRNDISQGGLGEFLGYPVLGVEVMPTSEANSQICCLFGNLVKAADFGDRQASTFAASEHATVGGESVFERNQIALRWTERWDINVHSIGTSSAAGPIVGLITAAS